MLYLAEAYLSICALVFLMSLFWVALAAQGGAWVHFESFRISRDLRYDFDPCPPEDPLINVSLPNFYIYIYIYSKLRGTSPIGSDCPVWSVVS